MPKPIALTEDEMTGEADGLRSLAESCLSNNPAKRPTIAKVSEKIKVYVCLALSSLPVVCLRVNLVGWSWPLVSGYKQNDSCK